MALDQSLTRELRRNDDRFEMGIVVGLYGHPSARQAGQNGAFNLSRIHGVSLQQEGRSGRPESGV
jgi:hypothetical protein